MPCLIFYQKNNKELEMCPKDMDAPEKLKFKLLTPEKLKRKLQICECHLRHGHRQMNRGNTICPFQHSSNGGVIKTFGMLSASICLSLKG